MILFLEIRDIKQEQFLTTLFIKIKFKIITTSYQIYSDDLKSSWSVADQKGGADGVICILSINDSLVSCQ